MIKKELTKITKDLVSFNTTSNNYPELKKCSEYIKDYFKNSNLNIKTLEKNKIISLYISTKKSYSPDILLNAHFDVVPGKNNQFKAKIIKDKLYGRGAIDDKGPLAIAMFVLKEISKLHFDKNIALLATSDEEKGGFNGMKYAISKLNLKPRFTITLDGGTLHKYVTKEKGLIHLKLTARGISCHGSRPWLGINAIEKLINVYPKIKSLFKMNKKNNWEKTINLGFISGGDAVNKVPDKGEMKLDIRYTEFDNPKKIISDIKNICAKEKIEVTILANEPLFHTHPENEKIKALLKSHKKVTKVTPILGAEHGASDARHLSEKNIPCIVTYPKGEGLHSDKEYIDLKSSETLAKVLLDFIKNN